MEANVNEPRIVVGVDGSPSSRLALRWAVRQAMLTGAVVDAVHAWSAPATFDMVPLVTHPELMEKSAEQTLVDAVADAVGAHPPARLRARVVQGNAAFVLIRAARGADLLVVGSRGHGGFVGALLGSIAQHCAQHAPCPVVVVRDQH
jgi:nucleotide-binding universal stress UspA family protein